MRKVYSVLLICFLSIIGFDAAAVNIVLNIDDPARVRIQRSSMGDVEGLVAGDNALSAEEYESIYVYAKDGAFLTSVTKDDGTTCPVYNMSQSYFYVQASDEGHKWTVVSADADASRDAACSIKVDDASKVLIQRGGSNSAVTLTSGEWTTVKFASSFENTLNIGPTNYQTPLYQVKQNGIVVSPQGTYYYLTISNEDVIEIEANYPEKECPIHFNFTNAGTEGAISKVTVNNVETSDWQNADFSVMAGNSICFYGNTDAYTINSVKINNETVSFYSSYSFTVTDETTIEIAATKIQTYTATLNITDPAHFTCYKGYAYNNVIIPLQAGANPIEFAAGNNMISLKENSGCYIESIDDGKGTTFTKDYNGCYNVYLEDGMNVTVTSGAIERAQVLIVYLNEDPATLTYFDMAYQDRTSVAMDANRNWLMGQGYNEVEFYSGDNPFSLGLYNAIDNVKQTNEIYVNDVLCAPQYDGGSNWSITANDMDVVKVYGIKTPEKYTLSLSLSGSAKEESVSLYYDKVKPVAWTNEFTGLEGSLFQIICPEDYSVIVNNEAIKAEAGIYNITLDANKAVKIDKTDGGIATLNADSVENNSNVYNVQGMLLIKAASAEQVKNLPAGMYIIGGKKVIVR